MKGKPFADTNILIYLFSKNEPDKRDICTNVVQKFRDSKEQMVWSTQVVQEFCYNMIKKRGHSPYQVKPVFSLFSDFELVINDFQIINEALDIQLTNHLSFWDSLILSSAASANCSYLLSEDLTHGQRINGVEIINPFLI